MFSSLKKLTGTALALIVLASPAYAADVTPEGAEKLKALIQGQIDLRKNVQSATGGQYITEGDLKVEVADSYYAVTMPHIKMKDVSGKVFDLGMIAANVIPGESDKEWKAAIAIPTPIRIIGADNKPVGQISIGTQRAVGVWDMDLSSFTRLDAQYDTIAFKGEGSPAGFTIGTTSFRNQLSREANGNLSGPAHASMRDWVLQSPDDQLSGSIKDVSVHVTIKDFDPKIAKSFNEQVGALGQAGQQLVDSTASPQSGIALYNMITNVIGKSSESFGSTISISGVSISGPNETTKAMETFELGNAQMGFDMSGFRAGSVKTGFNLSYDGVKLPDPTGPYTDMIPLSAKFVFNINNLPFQQLIDLGRDTITAHASNPEAGQMPGMTAIATAPKLLTDAGTTLDHNFDFSSALFKGMGNGVVTANMNAISGFTAEQTAEFTGLDKVIAKIQEEMAKPNNPNAQDLQSVLGPLTIMQMVGQQQPDKLDVRTYKLTVDAQGKTLLNGSDLSTLMGGGAAAPAPEGVPPVPESAPPISDAQ